MAADFFSSDPNLGLALARVADPEDCARARPLLARVGQAAHDEVDRLAALADAHPPRLRQYDRLGHRVDELEFHPAYEELSRIAFERFGFAAMSHRPGVHGWPDRVPHVVKYALSYLFVQAEFGLFCPVSMTDSAARVLRRFGPPDLVGPYIDRLTATDLANLFTGAMFMTEQGAGSDVGATETEARSSGDRWQLFGRKWFCSNVGADVVLTLARVPGGGPGTRGLGLFLMPRTLPDGCRNRYMIDRLKDKLGTRSMATGEVTLNGAHAWPVGEVSRGFAQMAEMINVSRLSNAMRSAALMRRAVHDAVTHTRGRRAFGAPLFEAPLMRETLLPLLLHAEASLALVLDAAAALDRADQGDDEARRLVRILTPLAKLHVCKLARSVTGEAMEVRGGNGYIEEWVDPRLLRDAHLGSIWEGSTNVVALDVARAMHREAADEVFFASMEGTLGRLTDPDAQRVAEPVLDHVAELRSRVGRLVGAERDERAALVGAAAHRMAETAMAVGLLAEADHAARVGAGYRKLLMAASYRDRVLYRDRWWDDEPDAALRWLAEIVAGGDVPAEAVRAGRKGR
ncbi:MAG: acyl-CoA dehydrogenase [Streptosporangiales bacterium]|nr:acyl-CoA dehydrogenase [Streptosporangiales bacterium]